MALISTRLHAAGDYAGGALMLAAARLPFVRDRRAAALLRFAGLSTLVASAATDYELGIWRKVPMRTHLNLDAASGAVMTSSALLLRRSGAGAGSWLPHALVGVSEIAAAALTEREPSDAGGSSAPAPATTSSAPAADVPGAGDPLPPAPRGVTGEGIAAREPGGATPVAPPPVETPGPSVTPPEEPESETEREERIDAALPDPAAPHTGDDLVAQQEAAAAAEAAAIGGPAISDADDPAMEPVYQAGGGEQDGWEAAERDLIENATHGDGHGDPMRDAITPEVEADRSTAVYGEGDHERSTEVVDDPQTGEDDPGQGPGLASERGPGVQPSQE